MVVRRSSGDEVAAASVVVKSAVAVVFDADDDGPYEAKSLTAGRG